MSGQPINLPAGFADYLDTMARDRAQRIADVLGALTPREQALVREAAVMGYVHGTWAAGDTDPNIPPDSAILAEVVLGCLAMPDLYPNLARGTS